MSRHSQHNRQKELRQLCDPSGFLLLSNSTLLSRPLGSRPILFLKGSASEEVYQPYLRLPKGGQTLTLEIAREDNKIVGEGRFILTKI